jgi:hypothetical protein
MVTSSAWHRNEVSFLNSNVNMVAADAGKCLCISSSRDWADFYEIVSGNRLKGIYHIQPLLTYLDNKYLFKFKV